MSMLPFARVLSIPAHELLGWQCEQVMNIMLLVALKPVGMHARFRQAGGTYWVCLNFGAGDRPDSRQSRRVWSCPFIVYGRVASDHDRGFFRPYCREVDHRFLTAFFCSIGSLSATSLKHFGVIGDDAVYFSSEHADILIRGQGVDDVHFMAFGIAVV